MTNTNDPLEELLLLNLNEIFELIKLSYNSYTEEEGWVSEVAKVKALEEFSLWYYGNKEKEISLRKLVNQL